MPQPRKSENDRPNSRVPLSRIPEEWAIRRAEAFQRAMNRKGLPTTWGTGVPRSDKAWKRDLEYLREDNDGKWP
jgi:hypothetical protein